MLELLNLLQPNPGAAAQLAKDTEVPIDHVDSKSIDCNVIS